MRMARAAGVPGVGIVSMLATAETLIEAGARATAASVADWVADLFGAEAPGLEAARLAHAPFAESSDDGAQRHVDAE